MKKLILFATCLLFIHLVLAQPVTFNPSIPQGFTLLSDINPTIQVDNAYTFHIHVLNQSNGAPITTGVSCIGHVYNQLGVQVGIVSVNTVDDILDYELTFNANNFTRKGEYLAKFMCNSSVAGGGQSETFFVTTYGDTPAGDIVIIGIYILFVLSIIFGLYFFIMNILNLVTVKETVYGVLGSWVAFLLLLFVNYLAKAYLLEYFIENISNTFLIAGGWGLTILPVFALIITMFKKSTDKKNVLSPQEITGRGRNMIYG